MRIWVRFQDVCSVWWWRWPDCTGVGFRAKEFAQKPRPRQRQHADRFRRHVFDPRHLLSARGRRQSHDGQSLPRRLLHRSQVRVARRTRMGPKARLRGGLAGERRHGQPSWPRHQCPVRGLHRPCPELVHPQPQRHFRGRVHGGPRLLALRLVHRGFRYRQHGAVRPPPSRCHRLQGQPLFPGRRPVRRRVRSQHVGERQEGQWSGWDLGRRRRRRARQEPDRAGLRRLHHRLRHGLGRPQSATQADALAVHGLAPERRHDLRPGADRRQGSGHLSQPHVDLLEGMVGKRPPPHRRRAR